MYAEASRSSTSRSSLSIVTTRSNWLYSVIGKCVILLSILHFWLLGSMDAIYWLSHGRLLSDGILVLDGSTFFIFFVVNSVDVTDIRWATSFFLNSFNLFLAAPLKHTFSLTGTSLVPYMNLEYPNWSCWFRSLFFPALSVV